MMIQQQLPPPNPSFPPKKPFPQPLSLPQQLHKMIKRMIHVQQLPPPKPHPQPLVADKSPIRNSSNYLYIDSIFKGKKCVTHEKRKLPKYCFMHTLNNKRYQI